MIGQNQTQSKTTPKNTSPELRYGMIANETNDYR